MSLHVLSHPWEVQKVADGTVVTITRRDLDVATLSILADELCELALEASPPTLYLDFGGVSCLAGVVCGKLLALERRLHERGGRLVLRNLNLPREEAAPPEGGPEGSTPV
jgi:anti-anti-sigma regulatory factor